MSIPGLTRLDHIGFTVPDIDAAREWLVDVLGCEFLYSVGPFTADDAWMGRHLNVPPGTSLRRLDFLRCGDQAILEVFQYDADRQVETPPRNSDIGGHHIALYVEDLDRAVAYLRERGVTVLGEPSASSGPSEGQRWVYFLAPWGMQLELVSYPEGKAFDRRDSPTDWVNEHIRRYVETDGEDGHDFLGFATLLLTTRGRSSGLWRRTALIYGRDGDRYVLVASNAAAAQHPHWYRNLLAEPEARLQVRAEKLGVRARTASAEERARLWPVMTSIYPRYDEYQAATDREIPVVLLEPVR